MIMSVNVLASSGTTEFFAMKLGDEVKILTRESSELIFQFRTRIWNCIESVGSPFAVC